MVPSSDSARALTAERCVALSPLSEQIQMAKSNNDSDVGKHMLENADSHGHAALFLLESLIHSLVDNETINLAEAQNIVNIAIDATYEIAGELSPQPEPLLQAASLLTNIRHSLGGSE